MKDDKEKPRFSAKTRADARNLIKFWKQREGDIGYLGELFEEIIADDEFKATGTIDVEATIGDVNSAVPVKIDTRDAAGNKSTVAQEANMTIDEAAALLKASPIFTEYLEPADNGGYICPVCGNGSGDDKTGATLYDGGTKLGCRHCGTNFTNVDICALACGQKITGGEITGKDFVSAVKFGAEKLGETVDGVADVSAFEERKNSLSSKAKTKDPATEKARAEMRQRDIETAQANIENLPVEERRGLTLETLTKFGVGYIADWKPTKSRVEAKYYTPSKRIIIPHCDGSYTARLADSIQNYNDWAQKNFKKKQIEGRVAPFNFETNYNEGEILLVTEGAIDAASIWQATGGKYRASATTSADGYKKFAAMATMWQVKPRVIVLYDADKTGREKAVSLVKLLKEKKIRAVAKFLSDKVTKIDANDILQAQGDDALAKIVDDIVYVAQIELDALSFSNADNQPKLLPSADNQSDGAGNDDTSDNHEQSAVDAAAETEETADNQPAGNQRDDTEPVAVEEKKVSGDVVKKILSRCDCRRNKAGNITAVKSTAANYRLIFERDPVLDGLFGYDEFQQADVFLKLPPWKKELSRKHEQWQDSDDSALRVYLRETYTELKDDRLYRDYFNVFSRKRSFHEVKDWLAELPSWDGVARAEKLFVDYLKVDDTPYAREVTMNFLFGALARIYAPGCEYQTVLVLQGNQGIGKSGILKMLGGKWHVILSDSVEDPHAVDTIQNGWLVELEEFWAGSKAEVKALKSFLSRPYDDRRAPYARRAQKSLRHCVFAITINNKEFLKDATGNRRYVILHCKAERNDNSGIVRLKKEIVAQIWAEALYKFRQKFPDNDAITVAALELSNDARLAAENIAQEHMVDDSVSAEIEGFLNQKIPVEEIWASATKEERRTFFKRGYLELDAAEAKYRLRDIPAIEKEKIAEIYATATKIEVPTKTGEITTYRFRGIRYRLETCAAEIANECFGTDARRMCYRINEVLAEQVEGWQLATKPDGLARQQKNFAGVYGHQRQYYFRVDAPPDEDNNSDSVDNSDGDDFKPAFEEENPDDIPTPF